MRRIAKHKGKAALAAVLLLWAATFFSPELAIRRYMFLHLHPIDTFTAEAVKGYRFDRDYGHLYHVRGYVDSVTGDELGVFYLKRAGPFWYVDSVGTGP